MFAALEAVTYVNEENDTLGALTKAIVAVLVVGGVSLETVGRLIVAAESRSSAVKTIAIMSLVEFIVDFDRFMLNRLVQIFEAVLKLAELERDDKGEYRRISTLCAFKKLIHSINTDPSTYPDDWTILNKIVAVILEADGIKKGTDNVRLAAVDLLTAIVEKQSDDRIHFEGNRLFWKGLISPGKCTLFDIISHDATLMQTAVVDTFHKKLDQVFNQD